jgi:DNA integrity scanning protein DisA with diadenylate cyclase activity
VITKQQELRNFAETGEIVDAAISARLIENIFFKNTPLHDGALIIRNGRAWSAACILPVSKRTNLPKNYGLRHRAALGITEKTDATAIVVSEETGKISLAQGEHIHAVTIAELEQQLSTIFDINDNNK